MNNISVEQLDENATVISEGEKAIIRARLKNVKQENFKDWKEVKNSFK